MKQFQHILLIRRLSVGLGAMAPLFAKYEESLIVIMNAIIMIK